jgi:glutamine synthetase
VRARSIGPERRLGLARLTTLFCCFARRRGCSAGVEGKLPLPPPDDAPYAAERTMLPTSLTQALDALDAAPLFRRDFGEVFIDYYLALKRTEAGRYLRSLEDSDAKPQGDEASEWEQNEYFDFF